MIWLVFCLQAGNMMRGYRQLLGELKRMLGRSEAEPAEGKEVRKQVHTWLG